MTAEGRPDGQQSADDEAAALHRRKRFRTVMWFIAAGWLLAALISALS